MKIVESTMAKNTVLFTRQPEMRTGQLFDLNLKAKHSEQGMIPSKPSIARNYSATDKEWTDKYGGYNSLAVSHFALIKRGEKKEDVYTFVKIPMIQSTELLDRDNLLRYCAEELGFKDVKIIRTKILFNTLISVDGFLMTITNSMNKGATLGLESAIPLLLEKETTNYVKHLEKFIAKKSKDKNLILSERYDEITKDENEKLYQLLLKKAKLHIYKNRPGSALKILENGFEAFCSLKIEDQVSALISFLSYLGMNNGTTNLKLIGGGPANGTLTLGVNIAPSKKKVFIVDQSITGIYDSWFELT
jgi:hypothetical protein